MSGIRGQHQERRRGIFYLRVRVPDDIRSLVGLTEVRRSLHTYEPSRARIMSAVISARLFGVFDMLRLGDNQISREEVQSLISSCFHDVITEVFTGLVSQALARSPVVQASVAPAAARPAPAAISGPTVAEAIDTYLRAKEKHWTPKTHASRRRHLGYLREHLGADTPLPLITPDHVRCYRDALFTLRRNTGRCGVQTFAAKRTQNVSDRVDPKTAGLIFEPCRAFFRWAKAEQGYLSSNPAEDIRFSSPKSAKGRKARRPFTAEELTKLFSAPLFTGCLSIKRRFEPGQVIQRDAKYWLPILGYYTGARLGELVQLHISDVQLGGAVAFIHITEEQDGPATGETKHVKSHAGVRRVPLHPDLFILGFDKFVLRRQRLRQASKRLFSDVKFGADGQASTVFSKFFGRLMGKAGLDDPALVFHSFRHNAEDAFRNAGQQQYVIDRIIGHSDGATSSGYGEGIDLDVAFEAVKAMKLRIALPSILGTDAHGSRSFRRTC